MEDYLGTVLSVDESIGQIMDYLKQNGLDRNTLVLYCGDQGFYMGEHGLYDKRWIFEESFRMPLIMRWPGHIRPGVRSSAMVQELDYAPTFCDVAGVNTKENMNTFQGRSLTPLSRPENIRISKTVLFTTPFTKIRVNTTPRAMMGSGADRHKRCPRFGPATNGCSLTTRRTRPKCTTSSTNRNMRKQ